MNIKGLKILAIMFFIVFLSACTGGENLDGKTVIRIATWDSAERLVVLERLAQEYMEQNEDVIIRVESVPVDYSTRILTQIAGGDAPDIFQVGDGDINMFQESGALLNLEPFVNGENGINLDDFFEPIMEIGRINGDLYVMPKDFSTYAIFYNKDMFDEASIEYPTDDWTWDDLIEIAKALTIEENGRIERWGIGLHGAEARPNLPLIYAYGGDLISEDGTTVYGYLNSDNTKYALEIYNSMINVYKIAPSPIDTDALRGTDLFLSERVAMRLDGIWSLNMYLESGMNFGTVMVPAGPYGQYTSLAHAGFGIYSESENPEAAWDFLKFLSTEGQEIMVDNALTAYIPASISTGQIDDPNKQTFVKSIDYTRLFPERLNSMYSRTAGRHFEQVLQNIISNSDLTFDIDSALDEAASRGQEEMQSGVLE